MFQSSRSILWLATTLCFTLSSCAKFAPRHRSIRQPRHVTQKQTKHVANNEKTAMKLATIAKQTGNIAIAEHVYLTAAKQNPHDLKPLIALANLYQSTDQNTKAIQTYQSIKAIKPNYPVDTQIALSYASKGYFSRAAKYFSMGINNRHERANVYNDVGVILDYYHQHQAAQQCYARVLKGHHPDLTLMNNLIISRIASKDKNAVQLYLNNSRLSHSKNPTIQHNIKWLNQHSNNPWMKKFSVIDHQTAAPLHFSRHYLGAQYTTAFKLICQKKTA